MKIFHAVLLISLFITTPLFASEKGAIKKRPNIIFVLVDDLDIVSTSPFFKEVLPHTMALKKEGVYFENTFVTTPLCCPSRASILSGKYGHNTNVLGNGGPRGGWDQFRDDEPTALPALLQKMGYRTALIGKYLNGYSVDEKKGEYIIPPPPIGWSDGHVLVSKDLKKYRGYNYHILNWEQEKEQDKKLEFHADAEKDYSTDVVKEKTIAFLEQAKKENPNQPYFAYINPTCPHFPIPPAPRHIDIANKRWGYNTFPSERPNLANKDGLLDEKHFLENAPTFIQNTFKKRAQLLYDSGKFLEHMGAHMPSDAPLKNIGAHQVDWHNRMGSLLACDEMVRDIVGWLKANKQWDNSIFIFASDNGYNLGAHGLNQKISPYEEAIRVPLLIAGGKDLHIKNGSTQKNWALNIDFAPTLLEMIGEKVPDFMDGRSLAPFIVQGEKLKNPWRKKFLIEYFGPGLANGHMYDFHYLQYHLMPGYLMDVPSFNAVRYEDENKKDYVFVSWEKFPHHEITKRRLRHDGKFLSQKRRNRLINETIERDFEFFNISEDPYQLSNLMGPIKLQSQDDAFAVQKEKELRELVSCHGQSGPFACP